MKVRCKWYGKTRMLMKFEPIHSTDCLESLVFSLSIQFQSPIDLRSPVDPRCCESYFQHRQLHLRLQRISLLFPPFTRSNPPWMSFSKRSFASSWSSAMWSAAFSSSRTSPSAGSWPRSSAPISKKKAWKHSSLSVFVPPLDPFPRHSTRRFLQCQLSAPAVYLRRVARVARSLLAASIRRPRCKGLDGL